MTTPTPQPRAAGGRFVPRAKPPLPPDVPEAPPAKPEPTATAELARRAAAARELLAAPPADAAAAALRPGPMLADSELVANGALQNFERWLGALAEAGATPADLQLAWDLWTPHAVGLVNPKTGGRTAALLERLQAEAGRQHDRLLAQAVEEARPRRVYEAAKRHLWGVRERLEIERRRYLAPLEAEVARAEAALAEAEKGLPR
jgi:hypothetical protein